MTTTSKPRDWDWVTARKQCSAASVFESLALAAKQNVEKAAVISQDGRVTNPCSFVSQGDSFSVARPTFQGVVGVRFYLVDQKISAEAHGGNLNISMQADLTLNDEGECRLLVDGAELQEWQFLKRALEPVLFGEFRR